MIPCDDIYYRTQVYFRQHYIDSLPNDSTVWAAAYRDWLAQQGCSIVPYSHNLVGNVLGVAPFYDNFAFSDPAKATMFILRWS